MPRDISSSIHTEQRHKHEIMTSKSPLTSQNDVKIIEKSMKMRAETNLRNAFHSESSSESNIFVDIDIISLNHQSMEIEWKVKLIIDGHTHVREKEKCYTSNITNDESEFLSSITDKVIGDMYRSTKKDMQETSKLQIEPAYEELKWKEAPLEGGALLKKQEYIEMPVQTTPSVTTSSSTKLRMPLHAEKTALLVVDVQPEYWTNCAAVRKDFPEFPQNLERTIKTSRDRGCKIIFVRADYRFDHSPWLAQFARLRGQDPHTLTEIICDKNAEDFSWEAFATPEGGDVVLPKTSWSSSSNMKLMDWLRGSGIDTVLVCGLITSVCVQHSAFSIFEAGFRTLLVTDASADRGKARHDAALALYGDYMYELITSNDLKDKEKGLIKAEPLWLSLEESKIEPREFDIIQTGITHLKVKKSY